MTAAVGADPAAQGDPAAHLAAVLVVEPDGPDRFSGRAPEQVFDRIYGGQLAAQSLLAAAGTVGEGFSPISCHVNFLKLGQAVQPVGYEVDRVAEGRTLETRVVRAVQDDRVLSVSIMSFQSRVSEHNLIDHVPSGPRPAPAPEALAARNAAMRDRYGPDITRAMDLSAWPIETRYVDRVPWADGVAAPANRLWMRSRVALPDDHLTQCAALLYAGDLHMFEPVLFPGAVSWHRLVNRTGYFGATLDYALWFHRPFRFDEWMLHEQEAPAIANSRGLATGRFWTSEGKLAASVSELVAIFPDQRS